MFKTIILDLLLFSSFVSCVFLPKLKYEEDPAVKLLKEYIQIDTRYSQNADLVVEFWRRQAAELNLSFSIFEPARLPICVLTLKGRQPNLPSIMLNSHSDVVPTRHDLWTYPPFLGYIDSNGDMIGSGTQDTKSVAIQYAEALRNLIVNNKTLERTVHLTIMPDEETGGFKGMVPFVETDAFESLNIGFVLDEGLTSSSNTMYATYVDKRPWQVKFIIRANGGHGASISKGNAGEKLRILLDMAYDFSNEQIQIAESANPSDYGLYTSLNVNMINGGTAPNVIPALITVVIDMRLSTSTNTTEFEAMLNDWLDKLGSNATMEYIRRDEHSESTAVDDSNPYWVAMNSTLRKLDITLDPVVCPATSDMLPIRGKGIPAFGFSTRTNMVSNFHAADEYISLDNFIKGIDIYVDLITALANCE